MKKSTQCPCGDTTCTQILLVHKQVEASYVTLKSISRSITQDDQLADDLLQQFCSNLIARPHNFIPNSNFIALCKVAIKRLYLNTFRNNRIMTPANSQDYEKLTKVIERGGSGREPSRESYRDVELSDLIYAMCNTLASDVERAVFTLLYTGYTGREIAEHLSMNVNTVHGMIRRIRKKILEEFDVDIANIGC